MTTTGIASAKVQENDVVCRLKDTDITVIVRRQDDNYLLVSRAIMMSYGDAVSKFGARVGNVNEEALDLWLDPLTLQTLTCPSVCKKGGRYWECLTMEDAISRIVMN